MISIVLTKQAIKDLNKAPHYIVTNYNSWASQVEYFGLATVRQQPSYHDEPLKGKRFGQRSVRLNKQWRIIYLLNEEAQPIVLHVLEVTPHDY